MGTLVVLSLFSPWPARATELDFAFWCVVFVSLLIKMGIKAPTRPRDTL